MVNLIDPFERETLLKKILKKDVQLSKKFAFKCGEFLQIEKFKNYLHFLDYSVNGIVWITCLVAVSYFINSRRLKEKEVNLFIALILDIIVVAVLKAYTQRPRPTVDNDPLHISVNVFSFPSGNSSRATILLAFFIVLSPIPMILWIPLYFWWFAICITRIMLRKHHILDVLGGIATGLIISMIVSLVWIEQESAIALHDWFSDERTVGSDAEVL